MSVDFAILHQIILAAQQSENVDTLPFRALFTAYDEVLARNGLDPDHDQIYLRFLFRLGDKRQAGQSLYQTFEALLEEIGIRLEFDDGENVTSNFGSPYSEQDGEGEATRRSSGSRGRSRRASFDSFLEADEKRTRNSRKRNESTASLSRLEILYRPVSQYKMEVREPASSSGYTPFEFPPPTQKSFKSGGNQSNLEQKATSISKNQQRRVSTPVNHGSAGGERPHLGQDYNTASEVDSSVVESSPDVNINGTPNLQGGGISALGTITPQEILYQPSKTQLLRDADTILHFHVQDLARQALRKWQAASFQGRAHHQDLISKATAHDVNILLRQAFEQWRALYLNKKQVAETKRFFEQLERKAEKARSLYLLTKAFTHWAQCSSDEIERTSVARRHILRTRYFNAWLEVTVVNNFKVRRQRLQKFLSIWRRRLETIRAADTKAVDIFRSNYVESVYWKWFWGFCERRVPQWKHARLKTNFLFAWRLKLHKVKHRNVQSTFFHDVGITRSCLSKWCESARVRQSENKKAIAFRNRKLLANQTAIWRKQIQYLPLAQQISSMVDWRIAYSAFSLIRRRHAMECKAEAVSRLLLVKRAFTDWNDRLRIQTLARQIDDRLAVQALYKWVIAERSALLKRLFLKRLKQGILTKLLSKSQELGQRSVSNTETSEKLRNSQNIRSVLRLWILRVRQNREQAQTALEYHAPRTANNTLQLWKTSCAHQKKLEDWSRDAVFYFRASRTFKTFQSARVEVRKQKRRNAYIQMRRIVKMNLARNVLKIWRDQSLQVLQQRQVAKEKEQQRSLAVAMVLFDRWKERTKTFTVGYEEADARYSGKLAHQYLYTWSHCFRTTLQHTEQANLFIQLSISKHVYDCLRTMQIKVLEFKSRKETARSVKIWSERRRCHNILRSWHEEAVRRRHGREVFGESPAPQSTLIDPRTKQTTPEGATRRAEEWTAFGDSLGIGSWNPLAEAQLSTTPLPSYLGTPSKRAARAKALVYSPTTPATPNLATPFQNRSRSLPPTDIHITRRTLFQRSTAGARPSLFEDIPEGSSNTSGVG